MLLKRAVVCCLRLWLCCWGNRLDNNIRNLRHVTDPCVTQYLCFQLAFSAQAQSPMPRNAAPSNCNTQQNLSLLQHLYNSFLLHNGRRLLLCADSTARFIWEQPIWKKKKQSWRRYNQRSGKQRFPCMHCHIWHEVPLRGSQDLFLPEWEKSLGCYC